ncbi:WXG100 family type VII secretion target [Homoserinimonas sp. OAct 916]|uniref:WXG100 family type VII secretion target n=1 Tax=Homoserinimonas sp. OAct 916 TaxID=2211450 RepID=UPI000DBE7C47|nr:WXG100 family type VII secretion target [Homoserinimonas sp. OAct 916]
MRYHVDSEVVDGQAAAIRATMGRLEAESNNLKNQLTQLESAWSGQAATAFQAIAASWYVTHQRMEEDLGSIAGALTHAGRQYADIEQANARLFA